MPSLETFRERLALLAAIRRNRVLTSASDSPRPRFRSFGKPGSVFSPPACHSIAQMIAAARQTGQLLHVDERITDDAFPQLRHVGHHYAVVRLIDLNVQGHGGVTEDAARDVVMAAGYTGLGNMADLVWYAGHGWNARQVVVAPATVGAVWHEGTALIGCLEPSGRRLQFSINGTSIPVRANLLVVRKS